MESDKHPTVAKLLKIMDSSPGFAGLCASVQTISSLDDDLDGGTCQITAIILRDARAHLKAVAHLQLEPQRAWWPAPRWNWPKEACSSGARC